MDTGFINRIKGYAALFMAVMAAILLVPVDGYSSEREYPDVILDTRLEADVFSGGSLQAVFEKDGWMFYMLDIRDLTDREMACGHILPLAPSYSQYYVRYWDNGRLSMIVECVANLPVGIQTFLMKTGIYQSRWITVKNSVKCPHRIYCPYWREKRLFPCQMEGRARSRRQNLHSSSVWNMMIRRIYGLRILISTLIRNLKQTLYLLFTENTPVTASTGKPAGFWMSHMKPGMKNLNMTKWEQIENLTQVGSVMYGLSYHIPGSDMPQHNQNDKRQYQEQYSPDTAALFI